MLDYSEAVMSTKEKLLQMLEASPEQWLSGEEIAASLSMRYGKRSIHFVRMVM